MFGTFMKMNTASTLGSGPLPSNTVANLEVVEREPEVTKDTVQPSTENIQPLVVETQVLIDEPIVAHKLKSTMSHALIDVYDEELTLRVDNEALTFKVGQTSKYSNNDAESINRIDFIDVACDEYFQEVLSFLKISKSGNPTLILDSIVASSSPTLAPFEDSDFLLEETDAFLPIEDDLISPEIDDSYYDSKGDICLLEE
nr:reverse transcriptase domain-containing protein [Tanacetum cinerariifolium]